MNGQRLSAMHQLSLTKLETAFINQYWISAESGNMYLTTSSEFTEAS